MVGRSLLGEVVADESNAAKMNIIGNDDCTACINSRPYWCRRIAALGSRLRTRHLGAATLIRSGFIREVFFDNASDSQPQRNVARQPLQARQRSASVQSRLSGSPQNIWIRERSQRSAGSLSWAPRQAMCSSKLRDSSGGSSARKPPTAVKAAAV